MKRRIPGAIAIAFAMAAVSVYSQAAPPTDADKDAMYRHVKAAQKIAGLDLYPHFAHRCLIDQTYRRTLSRHIQANAPIEPFKVFDNLYFVGQNAVSSWALQTSEGLIVFDTLNSADEAKTYIAEGLVKLGLKPADIKYIVITHGHGDHYAGAKYLKATYGARIMASKIDWDVMARAASRSGGPSGWAESVPSHDLDIEDGQRFTVGDTTLTFYITPGHSPGTVSTIFTVADEGEAHVVAMFGGLGTPSSAEDKKKHVASLTRFRTIAEAAGADALIANHQTQDLSLAKLELLRLRRSGDPNPYVIGKDAYLRYLDVQRECTLYAMSREGQK